mmetsp:Transcript_68332/g.182328  ORF Transcript_68332/g.182328 Transcript_68332/m.182328 type:complete len:178 (-) Transcript_68332:113-646(-)
MILPIRIGGNDLGCESSEYDMIGLAMEKVLCDDLICSHCDASQGMHSHSTITECKDTDFLGDTISMPLQANYQPHNGIDQQALLPSSRKATTTPLETTWSSIATVGRNLLDAFNLTDLAEDLRIIKTSRREGIYPECEAPQTGPSAIEVSEKVPVAGALPAKEKTVARRFAQMLVSI